MTTTRKAGAGGESFLQSRRADADILIVCTKATLPTLPSGLLRSSCCRRDLRGL